MQQNRDGEPKLYRLFGLFSLTLFLNTTLLFGSFEDFKRTQNSSFSSYRDANDAEFKNYLLKEWREYTAEESEPLYREKKPKNITPSREKELQSVGPKVNIKLTPYLEEKSQNTPKKKQEGVASRYDKYMNFFGTQIGFNLQERVADARYYPKNQTGIVNFFATVASSDYSELQHRIEAYTKELELNDWGVYLLVSDIAKSIYLDRDDRGLFVWFLLNKLGYDVKVGLSNRHIVLLHYSQKVIYSTPKYRFSKRDFYAISRYAKEGITKLYTYEKSYPNATKPLDLSLRVVPKLAESIATKELHFKEQAKEYSISISYNKNLIDFMATYPQADYETYFNAPMQERTYQEIAKQMRDYINEKEASLALNFVLRFVQKAFHYERDEEQFGHEKVMFAEETLFYEKSDCEDRAVLFSYLVRRLFGIGVVGVKYKDHIATALYIPMEGDRVKVGRVEGVIADPTYINANIGQSMPKYRSIMPESFIMISK